MSSHPAREEALVELLAAAGIDGAAAAAGMRGEIAAVRAPAERLPALAEQAAAIRSFGFRYVAIDITPDAAVQPDAG